MDIPTPSYYQGASPKGRAFLTELLGEVTQKKGFFDDDLFSASERFIPELEGDAMLFNACKHFWRCDADEAHPLDKELKAARKYLLKGLKLRDKWWFPLARVVVRKIAKKRIKKTLKAIAQAID